MLWITEKQLKNSARVSKMVSELFSHLCLAVASKLANVCQLAWVLELLL
jgi:hypothetical protein